MLGHIGFVYYESLIFQDGKTMINKSKPFLLGVKENLLYEILIKQIEKRKGREESLVIERKSVIWVFEGSLWME